MNDDIVMDLFLGAASSSKERTSWIVNGLMKYGIGRRGLQPSRHMRWDVINRRHGQTV